MARKASKIEPAVMTLLFQVPSGPAESTIDLSQVASIVNRRFYRQGINWAVAGFKLITPGGVTGVAQVGKLPNTWVTAGAWEKTMRAWLKQQNDAIEDMGGQSAVARFRDFKIHMDSNHVTAGFAGNLLPRDYLGAPYLTGEWEASQVVIPNDGAPGVTNEYLLQMVGGSSPTAKAMISGYANSRATPFSPDPVTPGPVSNSYLNTMFDVGDNNDDIVDNATDKNDNLPYDRDDYPGETANAGTVQYHDSAYVTATTIGGITHMKGGNFPCGLVRLSSNLSAPAEGSNYLQIDLVPGSHRGYLCEPMTEM